MQLPARPQEFQEFERAKQEMQQLHCNQNDQEKLDHLPGYTFGKDDESKWAIEGKIGFYLNLR